MDVPGDLDAGVGRRPGCSGPLHRLARGPRRRPATGLVGQWRCLSLYPVIWDVASQVEGLDVEALEAAVRTGRPAAEVWRHFDEFRQLGLQGSPTVVVGESEPVFNPGFRHHWDGEPGQGGTLVIDEDDPTVVRQLVEQAMESMRFD